MINLLTPNGFTVEVPENQYEDLTPKLMFSGIAP